LIDDFEGPTSSYSDSVSNINVVQDQAGNWRDGYWFAYSDGTPSFAAGTGYASSTALECSGTMNVDAGFVFTFTQPGTGCAHNCGVTYYDATVGGRYTGISFYAKLASVPSAICHGTLPLQVDLVDNGAVTDHIVAVPLTTTWQQFTIYYDQAGNANGQVAANSLGEIKFMPQNLGTAAFSYDFLLDDIQLVTGADPTPPTPVPAKMIADFVQGSNQVITNSGLYYSGSSTGNTGYWFTYSDTFGSTTCPVTGSSFFPDSPGYGGTNDFAGHFSGVVAPAGPPNYPFMATGLNFLKNPGPVNISAYTGIQFYAKIGPSATASGVWVKFPETKTATVAEGGDGSCTTGGCDNHYTFDQTGLTTSWTLYTIPFSSLAQQPYYGTTVSWDPTSVIGIQWEEDNTYAGTTVDLWLDNITFY
jgi:hypothetical protein